jgi:hypothetical protein
MGKSIVFDDVLLVSLVDCTYSLFFTLVVPAAGYNIMFVCSASYVFGLIILSRLRTLNPMYNILKRIQVLSDAHAMSKARVFLDCLILKMKSLCCQKVVTGYCDTAYHPKRLQYT